MKRFVRRRSKPFPSKPFPPPVHLKLKPEPKLSFWRKFSALPFTATIGAAIVLITFTVQEGKLQQIRDEMNGLRSARQTMIITKETLRATVGPMPASDIMRARAQLHFASLEDAERSRVSLGVETGKVYDASGRSEATVEAMMEVNAYLNDRRKREKFFSKSMQLSEQLMTKAGTVLTRVNPKPRPLGRSTNLKLEASEIRSSRIDLAAIETEAWENNKNILFEADLLAEKALQRQDEFKMTYGRWELYFFLLYLLGVIVALLGKVDGGGWPRS